MANTKIWCNNIEPLAKEQIANVESLPFIYPHVAIMPDCHAGYGCTVGSVIPTYKAIIPSCIGVDIGCGMIAVKTSLFAKDLSDSLSDLRSKIEAAIPVGFAIRDTAHEFNIKLYNNAVTSVFPILEDYNIKYSQKHQKQLGTLGGGNHFIELCLDENQQVWIMLHSGSRGIGNVIGTTFIDVAKEEMELWHIDLKDKDLAYLPHGTKVFNDYITAMNWAQEYASANREAMLSEIKIVLSKEFDNIVYTEEAINCHHNYVELENHYGKNVYVSRKGAVRARKGDLGIIPGSMGTKSYIVRGKGNIESLNSCSHGAGRRMSRNEAKKTFTLEDHIKATSGVECKKDLSVLDETPLAYKDIDDVMEQQKDLVDIVHTLKQVLCIKG